MLLVSFMYFSQSSDCSFSSFFFTPPFASGRHAAAATSATAAAAAALSRVLLPQLLVPSSADAATSLALPDTLLCLSSTPTYVTQLAADLSASELSHTVSTIDLRSETLNAAAASSPLSSPRGCSPSEAASSIGGAPEPALALGPAPPAALAVGRGVGQGARGGVVRVVDGEVAREELEG